MRCHAVFLISILPLVKSLGFTVIYKSINDLYKEVDISNEDDNENHHDDSSDGSSYLVWKSTFQNMMTRTNLGKHLMIM